eukprot:6485453-Amphidinium_carterae.1
MLGLQIHRIWPMTASFQCVQLGCHPHSRSQSRALPRTPRLTAATPLLCPVWTPLCCAHASRRLSSLACGHLLAQPPGWPQPMTAATPLCHLSRSVRLDSQSAACSRALPQLGPLAHR